MQESGNTANQYSDHSGEIIAGRVFALALGISLMWHLFWFSSVKIFVSAPAVADRRASEVSFVGSILEGPSVLSTEHVGGTASEAVLKRLRDPAFFGGRYAEAGLDKNEKIAGAPEIDVLGEMRTKSSSDGAGGMKQAPAKPFDKIMVSYKDFPSEIEGPVRFREVIYKPALPEYLKWDEGLGVDLDRLGNRFSIELKFLVSPEGKVISVERISSSGHPTVDLVGMRYLKGWQFAPLKDERAKGEQWGTVKLSFSLNKAEAK